MDNRYSIIEKNMKREIVLLKSFPCKYGKCAFCNYTLDNSLNEEEINSVNMKVLERVTGIYETLEVINSGSVFELPTATLLEIKRILIEKKIKRVIFEVYYGYTKRLTEIREYFSGIEVLFKMGLETFDNEYRVKTLKKNFILNEEELEKLSQDIYSICLLLCTKGQNKEMIDRDIALGLKYFKHITVNIFVDNGTEIKLDENLKKWFIEKYSHLLHNERVDLLITNSDFGVFEQ